MTKLDEIEKIVCEHRHQLAVSLPVHAVEYLLDRNNEVDRLREQKQQLQTRAKYYEDSYASTREEARVLRKELNRLRKEQSHGQANPQA